MRSIMKVPLQKPQGIRTALWLMVLGGWSIAGHSLFCTARDFFAVDFAAYERWDRFATWNFVVGVGPVAALAFFAASELTALGTTGRRVAAGFYVLLSLVIYVVGPLYFRIGCRPSLS
jgi:hypothetical protein